MTDRRPRKTDLMPEERCQEKWLPVFRFDTATTKNSAKEKG